MKTAPKQNLKLFEKQALKYFLRPNNYPYEVTPPMTDGAIEVQLPFDM
jgi:hypothetical protein